MKNQLATTLVLGLSLGVHAAVIQCNNPSETEVATRISQASDGDIVRVPAGTATWGGISLNKGVHLMGAGMGQTIISQAGAGGFISINAAGRSSPAVISGFTFNGYSGVHYNGAISISGGNWRFCSNQVTHFWRWIRVIGDSTQSLMDWNVFSRSLPGIGQAIEVWGTTNAWNYGTSYGTTNMGTYIEHNSFTCDVVGDGLVDATEGAKYVFRFNNCTNSNIGNHGCDSGGHRAPHSWEAYGNVFYISSEGAYADQGPYMLIQNRAASALVFSNQFLGNVYGTILLQTFRYPGGGCDGVSCGPWGRMTGSNPYDGNELPDGWPGLDQVGRTGPTVFTPTRSYQASAPMYIWDNTENGGEGDTASSPDECNVLNRDYYEGTAMPGYTPLVDPHPLAGEPADPPADTPIISLSASLLDYSFLVVAGTSNKTITVQNTGTSNLVGSVSTTAPFSIIGNANYNLVPGDSTNITVRYTAGTPGEETDTIDFIGGGATPVSANLLGYAVEVLAGATWVASTGTIVSPFTTAGNSIYQATDTELSGGGRAVYGFNLADAGTYTISMAAGGTNAGNNSVYVNIDSEPVYPTHIYDMPVLAGVTTNTVSWRGTGSDGSPQFVNKTWTLEAGDHLLWIGGREANVEVTRMTLVSSTTAPTITTQPQAQSVTVGQDATFTVVAEGTPPLAYQWYATGKELLSGATSSSYTLTNCTLGDSGGNYYVIVTNLFGTVQSSFALLTVTTNQALTTWYVDNQHGSAADDVNHGTESLPFRTINYALTRISGGHTVLVKNGTYNENGIYFYGPSGSKGVETTLAAYPGHTPLIRGVGNSGRFAIDGVSYMTISGLDIAEMNHIIFVRNGSHHITVTNCVLHDSGNETVHVNQNSYSVTFVGNRVYNCGSLGTGNGEGFYIGTAPGTVDNTHHVTIRSNIIYNTDSEGIEFKPGTHDCIAEYNVMTNCCNTEPYSTIEINEVMNYAADPAHIVRGNILHATKNPIRTGTGCTVYNNVIYNISGSYYIFDVDNLTGDNYNRRIFNNTINASSALIFSIAGGNMDVRNNIGPDTAGNLVYNAAYFINAGAHNYHLQSNTAPVNAGANLSSYFTTDFDGVTRTRWDLGAFAYTGPGGPVEPPLGTTNVFTVGTTNPVTFGNIDAPFQVTGDYLAQPSDTTMAAGGRAIFHFNVTAAGDYKIWTSVDAPSTSINSFYVNMDAEPTGDPMIWDINVTTNAESRCISRRGTGTDGANQFDPMIWTLNEGRHQLVVRGRDGGVKLYWVAMQPNSTYVPRVQNLEVRQVIIGP